MFFILVIGGVALFIYAALKVNKDADTGDEETKEEEREKNMQKKALSSELSATTYPGRGIVIGRSKDGTKAVTAYFIMERVETA